MTSNPQSRRSYPIEVNGDPTLTPWLLRQIDDRIRQHEIRVAIISTSIGIPLLLINIWAIMDLYSRCR